MFPCFEIHLVQNRYDTYSLKLSKHVSFSYHKIHVYQLLEITTSGPGTMYVADADVKKTYPGIVSCEIHVPNA